MRAQRDFRQIKNTEDYAGLTFNGIKILSIHPRLPGDLEQSCHCKCHCEREFDAPLWRIAGGIQKSCGGCGPLDAPMKPAIVRKDLSGQTFGNLKVLCVAGRNVCNRISYLCECECGRKIIVASNNLISGNTKSCGMCNYARETTDASHRIYATREESWLAESGWRNMIRRCYDPKFIEFRHYGIRGIYVCDEWRNNPKAYVDWCVAHGWKLGLSVDRINNDGPYAPWNCRIADDSMQANNKSNNRRITVNGETHTMKEWSNITGLKYGNLQNKTDDRIVDLVFDELYLDELKAKIDAGLF